MLYKVIYCLRKLLVIKSIYFKRVVTLINNTDLLVMRILEKNYKFYQYFNQLELIE